MQSIDLTKYREAAPPDVFPQETEKKPAGKTLAGILNAEITMPGGGFGDKAREGYYSELSILFSAGVDIRTALEHIAEEQKKRKAKAVVASVLDSVVAGSSLSAAMERTGKFSGYEIHSIRIGEETGRLSDIFHRLADFYDKKIKQRRQVVNALSYPAVVMATALGAVVFMMKFMVPMFSGIFKRSNSELPAVTQLIIDFSDAFSAGLPLMLLALASLIAFLVSQRSKPWYRKHSAFLLLRLPVFGGIVRKVYTLRFCQSMALLLGAKVSIQRSIALVREMIGFEPMEAALEKVKDEVTSGKPFHESLSVHAIFDRRVTALVRVGEEVNKMDGIFEKLSKQYDEEVSHRTAMLGSLVEPLIIIFLGLVVGVILVAMYLPLFQLSTGVM